MPEFSCPKCDAVLGSASLKCPLCGTPTRRGTVRHKLLRVRWYALLITVLGFVCVIIARGEPGKFLGMAAVLSGCVTYIGARFVDQRIRG
jgi:hypothetical protein